MHVYISFILDHTQENPLPILEHKTVIMDLIRNNRVVFLEGETGCGKSTQLPQFLYMGCNRILVTQPRRIAAIRIAERVVKEMKCVLGGLVGYGVGNDVRCSPDTRIMFCTAGYIVEVRMYYSLKWSEL